MCSVKPHYKKYIPHHIGFCKYSDKTCIFLVFIWDFDTKWLGVVILRCFHVCLKIERGFYWSFSWKPRQYEGCVLPNVWFGTLSVGGAIDPTLWRHARPLKPESLILGRRRTISNSISAHDWTLPVQKHKLSPHQVKSTHTQKKPY